MDVFSEMGRIRLRLRCIRFLDRAGESASRLLSPVTRPVAYFCARHDIHIRRKTLWREILKTPQEP